MVIKFKVSLILAFTIFRYNLCFVAVTYVSKTWVTKQLLLYLQAVCAVTFSGFFNVNCYSVTRDRMFLCFIQSVLIIVNLFSQ